MILRAATWEDFRSYDPMFRSKTHRITDEVITQFSDVFIGSYCVNFLPGGHDGASHDFPWGNIYKRGRKQKIYIKILPLFKIL
jgi:hypothetical protein